MMKIKNIITIIAISIFISWGYTNVFSMNYMALVLQNSVLRYQSQIKGYNYY